MAQTHCCVPPVLSQIYFLTRAFCRMDSDVTVNEIMTEVTHLVEMADVKLNEYINSELISLQNQVNLVSGGVTIYSPKFVNDKYMFVVHVDLTNALKS
jgi:hypothetical protein